jgi:hypothetical protein
MQRMRGFSMGVRGKKSKVRQVGDGYSAFKNIGPWQQEYYVKF